MTNWIFDYGAMCHITLEVLDSIPGSLEDMDKQIEVFDTHHGTSNQKGQVRIKMRDNDIYSFIATLHNVLLTPYNHATGYFLSLRSWIKETLVYYTKSFVLFTSKQKRKNSVTLSHSEQRKHAFFWENRKKIKDKEITIQKENCSRMISS